MATNAQMWEVAQALTREIARALITDLQTYSKMVTDSWFTTTEYSTEKFCDKVLDRFYYRV